MIEGRFYVRGGLDTHVFDRRVRVITRPGHAFCQTCLIVHKAPIGMDWHIERGPDELDGVDRAACGVKVPLEGDVDVRTSRPKNVCRDCIVIKGDEEED